MNAKEARAASKAARDEAEAKRRVSEERARHAHNEEVAKVLADLDAMLTERLSQAITDGSERFTWTTDELKKCDQDVRRDVLQMTCEKLRQLGYDVKLETATSNDKFTVAF